jgi:hypothetical protein
MKHGLTEREARKYTELNTEFDIKSLSRQQKELLESNFAAQVYAFRKLRDKLLGNEFADAAKLYTA